MDENGQNKSDSAEGSTLPPTSPPSTLSYVPREPSLPGYSRWAIASLIVVGVTIAWLMRSMFADKQLPFDVYKQWRIGTVGAILGEILAFAAYRRPARGRWVSRIAMILSLVVMLFALLVVPL